MHVNFHVTIHSNFAQPTAPKQNDGELDSVTIALELVERALQLGLEEITRTIAHVSDKSDEMKAIPLDKCTTLTQMIVRLFSEAHTRLDDNRFLTSASNYGFWICGHLHGKKDCQRYS